MSRLAISRDGAVCTITLADAGRLNPLGAVLRSELDAAIGELAEDGSTRVVVLRGEGRAFSAGADLRETAPEHLSWAERRRAAGAWQRTLDALEALPQVTVARLHGWAIGGAVLLAMACDIRVAAGDLRMSIPELRIGIPLTWAGLPRLVREIGLPRTRDLVMTGRTVTAQEALAWGMVTRLAPAAQLDQAMAQVLEELLSMPEAPLAMTRDALGALGRSLLPPSLAWSDPDLIAWSLREPEMRAAAETYLERTRRRRPGAQDA